MSKVFREIFVVHLCSAFQSEKERKNMSDMDDSIEFPADAEETVRQFVPRPPNPNEPTLLWKMSQTRAMFKEHKLWPSFIGARNESAAFCYAPTSKDKVGAVGLLPVLLWPEQEKFLKESGFDISTDTSDSTTESSSSSSSSSSIPPPPPSTLADSAAYVKYHGQLPLGAREARAEGGGEGGVPARWSEVKKVLGAAVVEEFKEVMREVDDQEVVPLLKEEGGREEEVLREVVARVIDHHRSLTAVFRSMYVDVKFGLAEVPRDLSCLRSQPYYRNIENTMQALVEWAAPPLAAAAAGPVASAGGAVEGGGGEIGSKGGFGGSKKPAGGKGGGKKK